MNGKASYAARSTFTNGPPRPKIGPCPVIGKATCCSGKRMKAIATLVERKTRFVMLIALPNGHAADVVADALAAKIACSPNNCVDR